MKNPVFQSYDEGENIQIVDDGLYPERRMNFGDDQDIENVYSILLRDQQLQEALNEVRKAVGAKAINFF